jgi:UDPglucose 6-dehydrogenase
VSPIFEPGLDGLIKKGLDTEALIFKTEGNKDISNADYVLIAHDTPVNDFDQSDISQVLKSIKKISLFLSDKVLIHVSAQIPVGTCGQISEIIKSKNENLNFYLTYSPENLRLGEALDRFRNPPLPVVGSEQAEAYEKFEKLFKHSNVKWHKTDLITAEMTKHALNTFLATCITFANELGNICDEVGADGHKVGEMLRLEPRIGSKAMLFPGLGFSGGTLARDIQTLRAIGKKFLLKTKFYDAIWESNKNQNNSVIRKLKKYFNGSLLDIKICVLGLTYKPNTSTLRRSASLEVISTLLKEGADVSAHDPVVKVNELKDESNFFDSEKFYYFDKIYDAVRDSKAIILMTPWDSYKLIDFIDVKKITENCLVFDTSKLWSEDKVKAAGFNYLSIGSGKF